MPTYTNSTAVLAELPASPPSQVTDYTAGDIADASGEVEALVGNRFSLSYESNTQKFPDIGSSPATPSIIKRCATLIAASRQFIRLEKNVGSDGPTRSDILYDKAMDLLDKIRSGEIGVSLSDGTALTSSSLEGVLDTFYEDRTDNDPIFTPNDLGAHLYDTD